MKEQTYEEFMTEIDEMCRELMAQKEAQREDVQRKNVPERVIVRSGLHIPPYANHYEYLHAYDLYVDESSTGAKYDTCNWKYKECTEAYPWDKCWYEDWAN